MPVAGLALLEPAGCVLALHVGAAAWFEHVYLADVPQVNFSALSSSIGSASHAGAARTGRRMLQDLASSVRHQLRRALLAAKLRV